MGKTTITVSESTLERFNELKSNTGDESVRELSSDQFVKSLLDSWEENGESVYGDGLPPGLSGIQDATVEEVERIRDMMEQLPERTADELEARI